MEAPEKIYLERILCSNEVYDNWKSEKTISDDIEYTRTDALIEKVLKFLDEKFYFNNLHHSIESGVFDSEEEMFEDFKNYMKGE